MERALHQIERSEGIVGEALNHVNDLVDWLQEGSSMTSPLDKVEMEIERRMREVSRLLLQSHVKSRGPGNVGPAVEADSLSGAIEPVRLIHERDRECQYVSPFGPIGIMRSIYQKREEGSVKPLEAALSLPRRLYSYELQRAVMKESAKGPFGEAVDAVRAWTGQSIPLRSAETLAVEAARDFEAFYERPRNGGGSATGSVLVAALDGKGVPVVKAPPVEKRRWRRLKKGEKPGKKREATVAAVYTVAPFRRSAEDVIGELREKKPVSRPPVESKRVFASISKGQEGVCRAVAEEMARRDPDRIKRWVCLMDGARGLQRRSQIELGFLGELTMILDLFHAMEYLWKTAHAFYGEGSEKAEQYVTERLRRLLYGEVSDVARGMRQSATKRGLKGEKAKTVNTTAAYFLRNKTFMRYDEYLRDGLPIGSGAAEGACRHLVKDRMERSGMRWTIPQADAILQLRAILLSGDWDAYWEFHIEQEHNRLYGQRKWQPAKTEKSAA